MTDYHRVIKSSFVAPWASFLDNPFLSDCEIRLFPPGENPSPISFRSHRIVLMNSSTFFANVFTVTCREAETGIVDLRDAAIDVVLSVLRWMYHGRIDFPFNEFITVYHYSCYLGIKQLEGELAERLNSMANPPTILRLCTQCYDRSYAAELEMLAPFIRRFLDDIPMAELTTVLDVRMFARVISGSQLPNSRRVELITAFIGNYKVTREDEAALRNCFIKDGTLKAALAGMTVTWLNPTWIRMLV
jgi:hypothetical protein